MQPISNFLHLHNKNPVPIGHNNRYLLINLLLPQQILQKNLILYLLYLSSSRQSRLHLCWIQHQLPNSRLLIIKRIIQSYNKFSYHFTDQYSGYDDCESIYCIEVSTFWIQSYVVFLMDCYSGMHEDRYRSDRDHTCRTCGHQCLYSVYI